MATPSVRAPGLLRVAEYVSPEASAYSTQPPGLSLRDDHDPSMDSQKICTCCATETAEQGPPFRALSPVGTDGVPAHCYLARETSVVGRVHTYDPLNLH